MHKKEVEKLAEQGKKLLEKRDFPGAEKQFARALALQEEASIRHNLALSVFMQEEATRAWDILRPNLRSGASDGLQANPSSHALAAQLLAGMDQEAGARQQLRKAIQLFEQGLARRRGQKNDLLNWQEHTLMIMKAAASLGEHRQVYALYRRWENYHLTWENRYLAGIAAFNQGYYARAAAMWASLTTVSRLIFDMQQVARLADRGTVPAFQLEYIYYSREKLATVMMQASEDAEARARLVSKGMMRMILLAELLRPAVNEKFTRFILETLIIYGGNWGRELGFNILKAANMSQQVKMSAASSLQQCGALREDEAVPVYLHGREILVEPPKTKLPLQQEPEGEAGKHASLQGKTGPGEEGSGRIEVLGEAEFDLEEKKRLKIEDKNLPLQSTLCRGLKNMPARWLEGMCNVYDLAPARLRQEREKEIVRHLRQPLNLEKVLQEDCADPERELLRYLLARDGWAPWDEITPGFGSMAGDGFGWEGYSPGSPLGFLWSRGLVLVGRTNMGGDNVKYVSVPQELQESLRSLLGAGTANPGQARVTGQLTPG